MSENKKLCVDCNTTYELTEFYKAGRYYQKLCKLCHNNNRKKYKNNSSYKKRTTGFAKLPFEKRESIITALKNKKPIKHVAAEHEIPYITLRLWRSAGQIN